MKGMRMANKEDKRRPGLHRVGPNPWDFEYKPVKGQRVSVVLSNGKMYTSTIRDFTEDEDTGNTSVTLW
jgi:hypothetical protein